MENKIVDKVFSFEVDREGDTFSKKFVLDKNVKRVLGLLLSANIPKQLFYRGSQRIEIGGDEIFPEEYESKILMSGLRVPPAERFRPLGSGVFAGNGEVKVRYTDTPSDNAYFSAYKVVLVLQCELS